MTWADINFEDKTFAVSEKLDLKFTPKDKEEGLIPIPDSLIELLRIRRRLYPDQRLIFTNTQGKSGWPSHPHHQARRQTRWAELL